MLFIIYDVFFFVQKLRVRCSFVKSWIVIKVIVFELFLFKAFFIQQM